MKAVLILWLLGCENVKGLQEEKEQNAMDLKIEN